MKNLLILVLLVFSQLALAENSTDPSKIVSMTVESAKDYLANNSGKLSEEQLQQELEKIIFPAFNFREMARRSLGKNWKTATPEERKEFVDLFSTLISKTYQKRVVKYMSESEFRFLEHKVKGSRALVRSVVKVDGDELDVNYRMKNFDGDWKVYDIVIANVSLVSNYRSEFGGIVRKDKMSGLIEKLKQKSV